MTDDELERRATLLDDVENLEDIDDLLAVLPDDEITPREREAIDERIEAIEDESRRYSTEEVADALGIDLDEVDE